jgi:hypothetical protein
MLMSDVNKRWNPMAPINRIPVEVLAHILAYTIHGTPFTPFSNPPGTPCSLLSVCDLWWAVALRSRLCWVGIEIDVPKNAFPNGLSKYQFDRLTSSLKCGLVSHIERAEGQNLDIWIRSDPSTLAPHPEHWSKSTSRDHRLRSQFFRFIASTLRRYSDRLRTLCGMNEETHGIFRNYSRYDPEHRNLSHLRLGSIGYGEAFSLPSLEFMFIQGSSQQWVMRQMSCPKLRSLSLMWKFNTRPRLDDESVFTILENFPLLEYLTANCEIVFQRPGPHHNGIKHINLLEGMGDCPLLSTTTRIGSSEAVHKFLAHFPNITSFGSNSKPIMASLVQSSKDLDLEQLNLEGSVYLPRHIPWNPSIQGLRRIRLGRLRPNTPFECEVTPLHPCVVKNVIDMLVDERRSSATNPTASTWNWPKLEQLELLEIGITKETGTALLDALRFRDQGRGIQVQTPNSRYPRAPQACLLTLFNCWLTTENDRTPLPDGADMDYPCASKTLGLFLDSVI